MSAQQIKNKIAQIDDGLRRNLCALHRAHDKSRWAALRNLAAERVQLEEQRETLLCIDESPITQARVLS